MLGISLLAPVPFEHLVEAVSVCKQQGKVAFGSRAWEVFRDLDLQRSGLPVDVFIYASDAHDSGDLKVSWRGRYVGHVEGINGAHPAGLLFRPASTTKYPDDNKGHWAVFWELDQLQELRHDERVSTSSFRGYKTGKRYKSGFVPKGPLIVQGQS